MAFVATAKYPAAIAGVSDLLNHKNVFPANPLVTLASTIAAGDTSIPVTTGTGQYLPSDNFVISIDNEIIFITSRSGDTLTVGTRGYEDSTAASHAVGITVTARVTALAHNQLAAEVNAIETALGASLSNVGGATVGVRASLPGAVPASGKLYICTDSPFRSYASDGTYWWGECYGVAVCDPAVSSPSVNAANWVQHKTASGGGTQTLTVSTTYGGFQMSGTDTGSGQNMLANVYPVTPSATLKISFGFLDAGQVGIVLYNSNTGGYAFIRFAGGVLYLTYYTQSGGYQTSPAQLNYPCQNPWPAASFAGSSTGSNETVTGFFGLTFTSSNIVLGIYMDQQMTILQRTVFTVAQSTWIGTNFTHVGFGLNAAATGGEWAQHFNIVHT